MISPTVSLEEIMDKTKKDLKEARVTPTDLATAQYYFTNVKNHDLRLVPPENCVGESKRLMSEELRLYSIGFTSYTGIANIPTRDQLQEKYKYEEWLQKEFARNHGISVCSKKDISDLLKIVGDFIELYNIQDGLDKLDEFQSQGHKIDWRKAFGAERYTASSVGEFWENIIKDNS